uniref:Creatinase N-terminal domain-containing protein n=1 Tax=Romanomermis culicivorax TaxID=13658 RepID=A0A915JG86_ROMCU
MAVTMGIKSSSALPKKLSSSTLSASEILTHLRALMSNYGRKISSEGGGLAEENEILSAYIIPSVDQHQSEYIADRDRRLKFVSNFSGSRGLDWREKIRQVRQQMTKNKAGLLILSALDDIAWLFNLRGVGDIKFNPVFFSFAVVGENFIK